MVVSEDNSFRIHALHRNVCKLVRLSRLPSRRGPDLQLSNLGLELRLQTTSQKESRSRPGWLRTMEAIRSPLLNMV